MGWYKYYLLLERYHGDLGRATKAEMADAASGNLNTPESSLRIAEKMYRAHIAEELKDQMNDAEAHHAITGD